MIPKEAIEAAAKEIEAPSEPAAQETARRALEAAAPHMLLLVWDAAYDRGFQEGVGGGITQNPYRSTHGDD